MRTKNAVKNLIFSLLFQAFLFLAGMIVPRFVILYYGSAVNGLTSSISRMLSLVGLVQAGAVGSAIYQMYEPVANSDYESQSLIISASKRFYNRVGRVYLVLACILGIFFGFYLREGSLSMVEIVFSFLVLAFNGSLHLFFTAKYDIVFSAYQKKYLLIIGSFIEKITYYSLLILIFAEKLHFSFMYIAMSAGSMVGLVFNAYTYRRTTHNRITTSHVGQDYVIPNRRYLMLTSIATEGMSTLPTIIVTSTLGLVSTSVFSVYQMIYSSLRTIINSIQLSVSAVFGNLVVKEGAHRACEVHKLLELVVLMFGTFLASCTAYLLLPFVQLYATGIRDADYVSPLLIVFVVLYVILFAFRTSFGYVATVQGLFRDMCRITLLFSGAGMVLSTLLTMTFGLPFVMIGVLFYEISYSLLAFTIVRRKVSWFSCRKTGQRTLVLFAQPLLFYVAGLQWGMMGSGWLGWIWTGSVAAAVAMSLILIYCVLLERSELRSLLRYVRGLFVCRGGKVKNV